MEAFDQREIATLLLLPLFLIAFGLGLSQTWRHPIGGHARPSPAPAIAMRPAEPAGVIPSPPARSEPVTPSLRLPASPPPIAEPSIGQSASTAPALPDRAPAIEIPEIAAAAPLSLPALALPVAPPPVDAPKTASMHREDRLPPGPPDPEHREPEMKLAIVPSLSREPDQKQPISPLGPRICPAEPGFGEHRYDVRTVAAGENFGDRLAEAARRQVGALVIYSDAYRRIAFPMGDVPPLFGVCTDVVIRAYRALGIDLQDLVHKARIGSGDASIDHRRTETLRRFFASRGQSLAITSFLEDYQPGDVVTYHRPQNRHSRSHIAIVSDVIAPSGRPMIVHNRGWGPQLEDALFVDQITGHYSFRPADNPIISLARQRSTKTVLLQRRTAQSPSRIAQKHTAASASP